MSNVAWQIVERVNKKVKEEVEQFAQQNEAARQYKVIPQFRVVRKVPREAFGLPQRVARGFLSNKAFLYSTNEQIVQAVSNWVPNYSLPANFMDKALSAKQLKDISAIMADAGLAFDRKVQKSLSKIKLAIQARKSAADAQLIFKGAIAFGKDCVVVGEKRFPFTVDRNGYQRIKVGDQKLRVDVLQALLEAGNLPSSTS